MCEKVFSSLKNGRFYNDQRSHRYTIPACPFLFPFLKRKKAGRPRALSLLISSFSLTEFIFIIKPTQRPRVDPTTELLKKRQKRHTKKITQYKHAKGFSNLNGIIYNKNFFFLKKHKSLESKKAKAYVSINWVNWC